MASLDREATRRLRGRGRAPLRLSGGVLRGGERLLAAGRLCAIRWLALRVSERLFGSAPPYARKLLFGLLILLEDHVEHCAREAIEDWEKTDEKVAELATAVERFLRV